MLVAEGARLLATQRRHGETNRTVRSVIRIALRGRRAHERVLDGDCTGGSPPMVGIEIARSIDNRLGVLGANLVRAILHQPVR